MGPIVTIMIAQTNMNVNNRVFEKFTTISGFFLKGVEEEKTKEGDQRSPHICFYSTFLTGRVLEVPDRLR